MQEFMVCPVGASGIRHAMQIAAEVYHNLKVVITEKYGLAGVCDILVSPARSQYVATDG